MIKKATRQTIAITIPDEIIPFYHVLAELETLRIYLQK